MREKANRPRNAYWLSPLLLFAFAGALLAQTTSFTYQGRLSDGSVPVNANHDFQFTLFDSLSGGTQVGDPQTVAPVAVANGLFTVQLDFGSTAFAGANRFLEIRVKPSGGGSFTLLSPRQQISSTPYAIRTLNSGTADALSSACVGCVQDAQINSVAGSKVSGAIPAASVPPGSTSYIQNTLTQQTASDFNISGNGLIGGIAGVGTTNPQSRFHVNGTSWFQGDSTPLPPAAGAGVAVGSIANGGYLFSLDYSTFTPKNLLLNHPGGNVGIGTINPQNRLEVQEAGLGITHTDGTTRLSTVVFPGGDASIGTTTNNPLHFFANSVRRMSISPTGNAGIGTDAPKHRLSLAGGPTWTSAAWAGAVELSNAAAIGWQANAGGQRFGLGQSGGGLYLFRTNSDPGSTTCASPPCTVDYDMLIADSGNVGIGTTTPTSKLHVNGSALVTPGGLGGSIQFGTPNFETGMTISGTARADVRFDGDTLKLLAGPAGGPPASTNGIAIKTSGIVGIGTTNPTQARLQVDGGSLTGIYGSSTFFGVKGVASGTNGPGVHGSSSGTNGYGLYGDATGTGSIGVFARGTGFAGYFDGNVHVTGNLTKQGGSFKIDHPLDPQNKYLSHSFVESPDMMNIYNGVVTLDSEGEAVVTLPGYFEALNRDFRYQLTCIGGFAPVYIAAKVENNRFKIAGGRTGLEVSWQVTGIRQDAYANAHRIPNEEEKPASERGTNLFPSAYPSR